jgi:hypothetical protein
VKLLTLSCGSFSRQPRGIRLLIDDKSKVLTHDLVDVGRGRGRVRVQDEVLL